jgi:hypothetical protein
MFGECHCRYTQKTTCSSSPYEQLVAMFVGGPLPDKSLPPYLAYAHSHNTCLPLRLIVVYLVLVHVV